MLLKTVTKSVELVSQVLEATHSKLRRNGNNRFFQICDMNILSQRFLAKASLKT